MTNQSQANQFQFGVFSVITIVIGALLAASLACSLTRESFVPTQTPTIDVNLTLSSRPSSVDGITDPTLTILSSSPESPINIGDTFRVTVQIEHEIGATSLVLQPLLTNITPGSNPSFPPRSITLPGNQPTLEQAIEWVPEVAGEYTVQITALFGRVPSVPQILTVQVNDPFEGGTPRPTQDLGPCIAVITSDDVALRIEPSPNARLIATLRQDQRGLVVERGRDTSGQGWLYIRLQNDPENREGWIIASLDDTEGGCANIPLRE